MSVERYETTIEAADRGGAVVAVPPEVVTALGGGGRLPVQATFDGVAYRGSVVSMGTGQVIGLLKAIRQQIGKDIGDRVVVTLTRDDAPRSVTLAADVAAALREGGVLARFEAESYTHQREHVEWIESAKRPETRARRSAATVDRQRT
jgi:Domain of unknown function (DUF1905)/Bacteriocin-protection, YdeI or OmpD-Associated